MSAFACILTSEASCALYERAGLALVYLQLLPPAGMSAALAVVGWVLITDPIVFSGLRGYALSKNLPLAGLILVLSLVPFGINMVRHSPMCTNTWPNNVS